VVKRNPIVFDRAEAKHQTRSDYRYHQRLVDEAAKNIRERNLIIGCLMKPAMVGNKTQGAGIIGWSYHFAVPIKYTMRHREVVRSLGCRRINRAKARSLTWWT